MHVYVRIQLYCSCCHYGVKNTMLMMMREAYTDCGRRRVVQRSFVRRRCWRYTGTRRRQRSSTALSSADRSSCWPRRRHSSTAADHPVNRATMRPPPVAQLVSDEFIVFSSYKYNVVKLPSDSSVQPKNNENPVTVSTRYASINMSVRQRVVCDVRPYVDVLCSGCLEGPVYSLETSRAAYILEERLSRSGCRLGW